MGRVPIKPEDHANEKHKPEKLKRPPRGSKVQKRPLIRPPIPSLFAGKRNEKVVYLSSKTPFMSAFKRVKKILSHVDQRAVQSQLARGRRLHGKESTSKSQNQEAVSAEEEEVLVKATGKAIEKALNLAVFLQKQQDFRVTLRTGTVDAIDDFVASAGVETPESQIRHTPMVEIGVCLRT